MSPLIVTWAARSAGKAAVGAACTPPSPLRRCATPSLTTPPHLRFVEVVRERGRRGAGSGCPGCRKQENKCKAKQACGDVRGKGLIDLQVAELAVSERVGSGE